MHNIVDSSENYLEAIYRIKLNQQSVRSIDVVNFLNLSKASVSRAMKKLKDSELIEINNDAFIELTEEGKKIATSIYEKHMFLRQFFINIGVDETVADEDACKVEHVISEESFEKMKKYFKL